MTKRLGLFTRLLADTPAALPAQVYRNATEQFVEAERLGFDVGWVAQHHFDAEEGGLPSPLVFLAGVAAHTARIRLATGIITAALEDPVRVAEDAAVLDAVSGGRVELGLGSGGSTDAFTAFGKDATARAELYGESVARLLAALAASRSAAPAGGCNPTGPGCSTTSGRPHSPRRAVHAPGSPDPGCCSPGPSPAPRTRRTPRSRRSSSRSLRRTPPPSVHQGSR
ncbi:MAG TPA: LLM class flavin-dependent oxidoreductase, partial [Pseudonocardia sp.]|uniref:LLM class flavin-dependent oxidoreductase n=1 Tax=Pseudonocardia sp. TaxID=60912 RepID=UPI002EDB9605